MADAVGEEAPNEEPAPIQPVIPEDFHFAVSITELRSLGRKRMFIEGRTITVFLVKSRVYAMDYFCYHAGGPLGLGDIEDSQGVMCLVCPWHKHSITFSTGESLYTAIDTFNPKTKKANCTKGVKQRVHTVNIYNDDAYVKLSDLKKVVESDKYYDEEYRQLTDHVLKEPVIKGPHRKHTPVSHVPIRTKSMFKDSDDEDDT